MSDENNLVTDAVVDPIEILSDGSTENNEEMIEPKEVHNCEVCHHEIRSSRTPSVTTSVKLHPTTPSLLPVEPVINNSVSRIPSIIHSINNSINSINSMNNMNNMNSSKNVSRRPSKANVVEDVKIEIADHDQEHLQTVDLNELVKSLSTGSNAIANLNNSVSSPLASIKEEVINSPTHSETGKAEFKKVKNRIISDIVVPSYLRDVKGTVNSRGKWRNSANKAELISKILTGAATIIAFSAGAYTEYTYLSFIAGCVGTGAMVCQQFSTYARGECKERTDQANKILKVLGIDSIPDLDDGDE